jgi:hypothetical protein
MEVHEELYSHIKKSNADLSLYYTGFLLSTDIESLQLTWIKLASNLGEYCQLYFNKWLNIVNEISDFIQTEEVFIKTAFIITTKLCILYQTSSNYISVPKKTVSSLRNNIIDVFEVPLLDKEKYKTILPKPSNESDFCIKIISGLMKLWNEKKTYKLRETLEYLCRKDYSIENDFIDFLWNFFKLLNPSITNGPYIVFKAYFRKKDKTWRYGLIYALHNFLNETNPTWTVNELYIIEQVTLMIPQLWSQFNKVEKEEKVIDKMHLLSHYFPKKMKQEEVYEYPTEEPTKKILVKK